MSTSRPNALWQEKKSRMHAEWHSEMAPWLVCLLVRVVSFSFCPLSGLQWLKDVSSTLQIKFYHNTCLRFFSSINQLNHQTISGSSLIMEKNPKNQTLPTKSSCTQPFIFQSAWLHSNEFYWQLGRNKAFTVGDEHIHAIFCVIPIFPLNSAHNKCLLEVYIQR